MISSRRLVRLAPLLIGVSTIGARVCLADWDYSENWVDNPAWTPTALQFDTLSIADLETIQLEPIDLAQVLIEDEIQEEAGLPPRFAIPHPVDSSPEVDGQWEPLPDGRQLWRLHVVAEDAASINLGFTEYVMPEGGRLLLYAADLSSAIRPFTALDNQDHGQLWTPILPSNDIVIEVTLPDASAIDALALSLGFINYGYRGFGTGGDPGIIAYVQPGGSGACNVDVACEEGDPWEPEIPSVAVLMIEGSLACSGFLVNNTAVDGTPYLISAKHCVNDTNAPTLVAYWNYENSECRPPGTPEAGGRGDGDLDQYTMGALFRAKHEQTDTTLVELIDSLDQLPGYGVTYAGWNRTPWEAASAVTVHHPQTEEKRISFEYEPTSLSSWCPTIPCEPDVPGDGTHILVTDWDLGTTEPGSSGSPLFDENHRAIGMLHGGPAACGNDESDYYGRFAVAWTGAGSSAATRLLDWLDPLGLGVATLDTFSPSDGGLLVTPPANLVASGQPGGPFGPESMDYTLTNLSATPLDYEITCGGWLSLSQTSGSLPPWGTTTVTVSINVNATALPIGPQQAPIQFTNLTDGIGNVTRFAELAIGAQEHAYAGPPLSIPDFGSLVSTIQVTEDLCIADLNLELDITHTFVGDLIVTLEHNGTAVTVIDRPGLSQYLPFGCPADNYVNLALDDEADGGLLEHLCMNNLASPPSYFPLNRLAVFDGYSALGEWTLTVSDNFPQDVGVLNNWSIEILPQPGTCPLPQPIQAFPLDVDPGWTADDPWAFGQPLGFGGFGDPGGNGPTGNPDPTSGYTGLNVFGVNLEGNYPIDLPAPAYLTTTAIDCSAISDAKLRFRRWLGIESAQFDQAHIQASNNGVDWVTIWEHTGPQINDGAWTVASYDISAIADGQPTVFIRWGLGPTDSWVVYCGWNIDDIEILGIPSAPETCPTVPGDMNALGGVNGGDIALFVDCAVSGAACPCADMDGNGSIEPADVEMFVACLLGQTCPQ